MAQLIGLARLGRDCELRTTQSGDAVASLSLAMDYRAGREMHDAGLRQAGSNAGLAGWWTSAPDDNTQPL